MPQRCSGRSSERIVAIFGVINHRDQSTHLCTLEIAGSGPDLDHLLPSDGWRPLQGPPGVQQGTHPSPVAGVTVMLGGRMIISVAGGTIPKADLLAGDMLILLDSRAPGHATDVVGPDWLRAIGIKLPAEEWPRLRDAFEGWPEGMEAP